MRIIWQWKPFEELSGQEMHTLLSLRQEVFVVEQACAYQDADALDRQSWHLLGTGEDGTLKAYALINFPAARFEEASIGRLDVRLFIFRNENLTTALVPPGGGIKGGVILFLALEFEGPIGTYY